MKKITIMFVDIDGCLTPGEGRPADLDALARIRAVNEAAASDPAVPRVTLCTGRQQPFVDLMCQILGCRAPAVFENGAGVHVPEPYDFIFHPAVTPEARARLHELRLAIDSGPAAAGRMRVQPGKEASLSVYPRPGHSVQSNADDLRALLDRLGLAFDLDVSNLCINILLPGLDKLAGMRLALERAGLDLEQAGAVGDAIGDLCYIEAAGWAGVPANARPELKAAADFVSPLEFGAGTADIIEHVIARNRAMG